MRVFVVGSPRPYQAQVRIYEHSPAETWDGFTYNSDVYLLAPRLLLHGLGIAALPSPGSRTIIEMELTARTLRFEVNGDTQVKESHD